MMAIVLDRVTTAWSQRPARRRRGIAIAGRRSPAGVVVLAVAAIIGAVVVGREVLMQQDSPRGMDDLGRAPANATVEWSRDNLER